MTRTTGLAVGSLFGCVLMLLSGGDASNAFGAFLYAVGSTLYFGAVGLFCLSVRGRGGNEKIRPEAILFALTLISNFIVIIAVRLGLSDEQILKFLKFLPAFGYFGLLHLTAVSLVGFDRSKSDYVSKAVRLMLFPFFAGQLERDKALKLMKNG